MSLYNLVDRKEILSVYDRWHLEDFDVVAFAYTPISIELRRRVLEAYSETTENFLRTSTIKKSKSNNNLTTSHHHSSYIHHHHHHHHTHSYHGKSSLISPIQTASVTASTASSTNEEFAANNKQNRNNTKAHLSNCLYIVDPYTEIELRDEVSRRLSYETSLLLNNTKDTSEKVSLNNVSNKPDQVSNNVILSSESVQDSHTTGLMTSTQDSISITKESTATDTRQNKIITNEGIQKDQSEAELNNTDTAVNLIKESQMTSVAVINTTANTSTITKNTITSTKNLSITTEDMYTIKPAVINENEMVIVTNTLSSNAAYKDELIRQNSPVIESTKLLTFFPFRQIASFSLPSDEITNLTNENASTTTNTTTTNATSTIPLERDRFSFTSSNNSNSNLVTTKSAVAMGQRFSNSLRRLFVNSNRLIKTSEVEEISQSPSPAIEEDSRQAAFSNLPENEVIDALYAGEEPFQSGIINVESSLTVLQEMNDIDFEGEPELDTDHANTLLSLEADDEDTTRSSLSGRRVTSTLKSNSRALQPIKSKKTSKEITLASFSTPSSSSRRRSVSLQSD